MDIQSLLSTVMAGDSVAGVGKAANVSSDSTKSILSAALPGLLSGALAQAQNSETAEGFASALTQHAASDTSNISSFLSGVDLADGGKIIQHLLGGNTGSTISQVAQQTGASQEETTSVLSAAAPLLMSLLGQQTGSQQAQGTGIADIMGSLMGGANLTSILGSMTGAADAAGTTAGNTGKTGLAAILKKLFG